LTKIVGVSILKPAMGTNEHVKTPSTDEDMGIGRVLSNKEKTDSMQDSPFP
jgi:hypothetical protein